MEIFKIRDHGELAKEAALWFHTKWAVPLEAYEASIQECLAGKGGVPQWYVAAEQGKIIGGLGVIEHDFHDRKDLTPNLCALYVEEDFRCRGIAGALLDEACMDMAGFGIDTLYLITDHTSFYERYGWEFLCMVREEGEEEELGMIRMYVHKMDQK